MSATPNSAAPRSSPSSGTSSAPGDEDTLAADATLGGDAPTPSTGDDPSAFGRFVVLRMLGEGGLGRVYAAYDESLDRRVAVKVLKRDIDDASRRRLVREAKAMAKLSHRNVVGVFEVGEHEDGAPFIAMEYVDGEPLAHWQRAPGRGWQEILPLYCQAAAGLAAAHDMGLVHRDFKPHNVMVETSGDTAVARVLDFGIVQVGRSDTDAPPELDCLGEIDPQLTAAGSLLGTPAYMAPEQFRGAKVTAAADQISLCVSLGEGLYRERPFTGDSLANLVSAVLSGDDPVAPPDSDVPRWVRDALLRGLSRDPSRRFPSVRALAEALSHDPVRARRRRLVAGAVVLGGAGLGVASIGVARNDAPALCDPDLGLAQAWDAERRERVRVAIEASDETVWARVRDALDDYARRWDQHHREICADGKAELREDERALALACLERARVSLDQSTLILAAGESSNVAAAEHLLRGLVLLEPCVDPEVLRARAVAAPKPAVAAKVAAAREGLSRANLLSRAGDTTRATALIDAALAEARAIDYAPLAAEALVQAGGAHDHAGRFPEAVAAYREALVTAIDAGHRSAIHEAAVSLMGVLAHRLRRHAEAKRYYPIAEGTADENRSRAEVRRIYGVVLALSGDAAAAEPVLAESLALMVPELGSDHPQVAAVHETLANALRAQGRYEGALAEHDRALEIRRSVYGAGHLEVMLSRSNRAAVLLALDRDEEAEAEFRAVLAARQKRLGPDHADTAQARANVAAALGEQGRSEEARDELVLAVEDHRRIYGDDHPATARTLGNLALALGGLGETDRAIANFREALRIYEATLGPTHPAVAGVLTNFGSILRDAGRAQEATVLHRRALSIRESAFGPDSSFAAESHFDLALALAAQGRAADAVESLERALSITKGKGGPQRRARRRWGLARLIAENRSDDELDHSIALARAAAADLRKAEGDHTRVLAEIEAFIGTHAPERSAP
ncbi:MAG: serine/threonine-protein kinase [Myxococcota bacterium]